MTLGKSLNLSEHQLIIAIIPVSLVVVRIKRKCRVELLCQRKGAVQMLVLIILHNYDCSTGGMCVSESRGRAVREGGPMARLCVHVYCVWMCLKNWGH